MYYKENNPWKSEYFTGSLKTFISQDAQNVFFVGLPEVELSRTWPEYPAICTLPCSALCISEYKNVS